MVENGSLPQEWTGRLPELELADEWVLGAEPEREETRFSYLFPEMMSEGPDEQIGVFMMRPPELRVFDREGRFLWKAGRQGDGPGEFRYPNGLCFQREIGWVVSERGRLTVFDERGNYVRTVHLENLPYAVVSNDFHVARGGRFWYRGYEAQREEGAVRGVQHIVSGDWQQESGHEVYWFSRPALIQEERRIFMWEEWPTLLRVDDLDRAWFVGDLPYQIEVIPHEGEGRFRIRRDHESRAYDTAYRERVESDWQRYSTEPMIWPRLPPHQAAIRQLSRGPVGEMWVFTRAWVDSPMVQVDVFDREGTYVQAFLADIALGGLPFAPDHVYRSDTAEDGAPLLVRSRYRIVFP